MIHLLFKCMRYADCTAQASTRPFIVSVKRQYVPLTPLWTTFFGCVPLGKLHPPTGRLRRTPVFLCVVSAVRAPPQTPIRIKASWRLAPRPDVCPWHLSCPRKPSVPCRVQSCTAHKCHGSLMGPVSRWLTAEAAPDSTLRW